MKVVLTYDMGESFVEELQTTFPELDFCPAYGEAEQMQEVADAEVVFGLMTRPVFLAAKKLKWLHYVGIGFDSVVRNIPEFRTGDVVMTNARQTHVVPMADHVFAAILSYAHRIPELLEDQRNHQWNTPRYLQRIIELAGTKMGVLAMGDIGRAVATRAAAFGIEVYAVDILPMEPPPGVCAVWPVEQLGRDARDDRLASSNGPTHQRDDRNDQPTTARLAQRRGICGGRLARGNRR